MNLAKEFFHINIRTAFKKALLSNYSYCIFNLSMPFKMYRNNLKNYTLHNNNNDIGVILNNSSTLEKEYNSVLFKNKKALAQSFSNKTILKLCQPLDLSFSGWIKLIQPYVSDVGPSFVMLPINNKLNISRLSECILSIQEINSILISFVFSSEVVFYQQRESLSSLAYLIHNVGFPDKTSLCLNIDFMEKDFYSLNDILKDIHKFNILNKISMVSSDKYTLKDPVFNEFLNHLNDNVIVFGKQL